MSGLLTRGCLALALVACTSSRTTSPTPTPAPVEAPAPTPEPAPTPQEEIEETAQADRMFLDQMIPHHQHGVRMAALAQNRAKHPELKALAGELHATQMREIDMMTEWRNRWYGDATELPMDDMAVDHMPSHELPMGTGAASVGTPGAPGTTGTVGTSETEPTGTTTAGDAGVPGAPGTTTSSTDPTHPLNHLGTMDMSGLEAAQGEEFDQVFLATMIRHHEEALRMAELARDKATHPELEQLLDQMTAAQTAEIGTMRQWQTAWAKHPSH
jgi:uncharacterized protein (DUF305 family)